MQHIAGVIVIALVRPCRNILTLQFSQILQITAEDLIQRMVIAIIGSAETPARSVAAVIVNIGQGFGLGANEIGACTIQISGKKLEFFLWT